MTASVQTSSSASAPLTRKAAGVILTCLCVIAVVIWGVKQVNSFLDGKDNDPRKLEQSRNLVLQTYESLRLGMTVVEVSEVIAHQEWPDGWCNRTYLNESGTIILSTPFELGAKNWILHLMFREKKLAAFVVRTMDSESEHPPDSPPDVLTEEFTLPEHF